jgi:hypothetical protein
MATTQQDNAVCICVHAVCKWGPGLATFGLPLVILAFVSCWLGTLLPSEWYNTAGLEVLASPTDEFKRFAYDVDGRLNFTIMSVAIWIAGPVAVLLSGFVLVRAVDWRAMSVILPCAILVGLLIAWGLSRDGVIDCKESLLSRGPTVQVKMSKGFRAVVIDNIMCAADLKQRHPEILTKTERMITINTYIGLGGAAAVMAALAGLAVKDDRTPVEVPLRRRVDDFRTLTLMGSVLFFLNALVTKALVTWTQSMLASPDAAASYGHLANTQLNFWAAQSSTVLFATLACSAFFVYLQIEQAAPKLEQSKPEVLKPEVVVGEEAAQKVGGDAVSNEQKWKQEHGLSFDMATIVMATIGTIAPLLAGPAADLIAKVAH